MNHTVKLVVRATTAAAILALGQSAFAAPEFSANIELDNTNAAGSAVAAADRGLTQSGRVELNATSKAGSNMFVAGKASFMAGKAGAVTTDDMWIQLGSAGGDVKLGRFESADLFPLAGDTLVVDAGGVYKASALRGRMGNNVFHAQGTLNLGGGLSLELGVVETTTTSLAVAGAKGVRPVLAYAAGALTLRAGLEKGEYTTNPTTLTTGNKVDGYGVTGSYDFGGFKLVANVAQGKSNDPTDNKQTALGLSAAVGPFAAGFVSATNEKALGDIKVQTVYASYNIPLFDVKGASVTPAISSSTAKDSVLGTSVDNNSFRIRLNYTF